MKKLFFLLFFLPVVALSQEDLQKSAETFVSGYFKNWEDKKWDEILNSVCEDGSWIGLSKTSPLNSALKRAFEYFKSNLNGFKAKIYTTETEVLSQTTTRVIVRGIQTLTVSGKTDVSEFMSIYILERIENNWKFKSMYNLDFNPFIFGEGVEMKWQTGRWSSRNLLNSTSKNWHFTLVWLLEERKKDGLDLAELGKRLAASGAKDWWNNSTEFSELVEGIIFFLQCYSPYIEVLERNDNILKVRYQPALLSPQSSLTKQEYLDYFRSFFGELSSIMRGTCSIVEDGEYLILTAAKK